MTIHVVQWLDAVCEIGWIDEPLELSPAPCTSVGFIVRHDEKAVTLAQTKADDEQSCNLICIPMGMVISIKEVKY